MTIGLAVLLLLAAVLVNGKFYRSNFTECKCVCLFFFWVGGGLSVGCETLVGFLRKVVFRLRIYLAI